MAEVETVGGPVDVGSLGQVLMHEHLRERGVTDDQLTTMLVDNPRRYFTGPRA